MVTGLLRVARTYVSTDASAQEVVQETWLAVVRGLDRFEGRSSLRTWVFSILANVGRTRGVRESRSRAVVLLRPGRPVGPTLGSRRFRGPEDEWPCQLDAGGHPTAVAALARGRRRRRRGQRRWPAP